MLMRFHLGTYAWHDGAFLAALRAGAWVILDELNLAPQSVLEGLNACLDHRASVYIPELGASFECAPGFRVFGCIFVHCKRRIAGWCGHTARAHGSETAPNER